MCYTSTNQGLQEVVQAMSVLKNEIKTLRLEVDRLERQNQNLEELMRQLMNMEMNVMKDTGHDDRQEFEDSIDEQEVEESFDESKVEDWCTFLDNPKPDIAKRAMMIQDLKKFANFLTEDK